MIMQNNYITVGKEKGEWDFGVSGQVNHPHMKKNDEWVKEFRTLFCFTRNGRPAMNEFYSEVIEKFIHKLIASERKEERMEVVEEVRTLFLEADMNRGRNSFTGEYDNVVIHRHSFTPILESIANKKKALSLPKKPLEKV